MEKTKSVEEELKLIKITRKKINRIEKIEREIEKMEGLETEMIEDKLLNDLNMEKGFGK